MAIWNRITREQAQRNPYAQLVASLSDDERSQMKDWALMQKARQGGGVRGALDKISNIALQMGGVKAPEISSSGGINDILAKEYAKQYAKSMFGTDDPIKEVKLEMEKTKLENLKNKQEADIKKQEEKDVAADVAKEGIISNANDMLNTIGEIKKGMQYFGPLGNLPTQATPGGIVATVGQPLGLNKSGFANRQRWVTNIDRLLALKGFDMMKELKNASRTGATGLGQLSEKEGEWLRQASTALKKDISQEQATEILNEMERLYTKVLSGKSGSMTPTQAAGQGKADAYSRYLKAIGH